MSANRGQPRRLLSLHEHLSHGLMREAGINVVRGGVARTPEAAVAVSTVLGGRDFVVKAQVLAGGRGKGAFAAPRSPVGGGVQIAGSPARVHALAAAMLGGRLITAQTGPEGRPVDAVYVTERCYARREAYVSLLFDREACCPMFVASAAGGVDIEAVARTTPDRVVRVPIRGAAPSPAELDAVVAGLGWATAEGDSATTVAELREQLTRLHAMFLARDLLVLEVNPLVETHDARVLCLDAKLNFDDSALWRQPGIAELRDWGQEDPRERRAAEAGLHYIGLDGDIACLVNGAGLAMATMDAITARGGGPANFLDVGGAASADQIEAALEMFNADPRVRAILVNIFGGILRCDLIANGLLSAARRLDLAKPVIVRLAGTNVDEAREVLRGAANLSVISAPDLDAATAAAVACAKIQAIAGQAGLVAGIRGGL